MSFESIRISYLSYCATRTKSNDKKEVDKGEEFLTPSGPFLFLNLRTFLQLQLFLYFDCRLIKFIPETDDGSFFSVIKRAERSVPPTSKRDHCKSSPIMTAICSYSLPWQNLTIL